MGGRSIISAFALSTVLSGCLFSDTVNSHYDTLAEAHKDGLVARGWLPDVLPPSSYDIRMSNQLDINYSTGEFHFAPNEMRLLTARLTPGLSTSEALSSWQERSEAYIADGFSAWHYREDDTVWAFFCREDVGKCEYIMELERQDRIDAAPTP
jgi:hypothetical protein